MAVAIVQTAFLGDAVLATPLFEAARKSLPGQTVTAVVRAGCADVVANNPFVDIIVEWDKRDSGKGIQGILGLAGKLRSLGCGTALIPHRSFRTALAVLLSGTEVRVGFSKGGGALLHTIRVPYRTGIHEVERNLLLAGTLGWDTNGCRPRLFPDENDREAVDTVTRGIGAYCVLAPGSVWATKMWPVEHYIQAGRIFVGRGLAVVLSGGDADRKRCGEIAGDVPGALDLSGRLTARQSSELYRRAEFLLTGDTAPQHIAAAVDARVFSLFGPTVRDFGFSPYTDKGTVIEESLDCRPCGIHGHQACPLGTHACMKRLIPEKVIAIIDFTIG